MRNPILGMLLLAGLALGSAAQAQTWDQPWWFTSDPYAIAADTCDQPPQLLYMDGGAFEIYAPAHIYRVAEIFDLWKPSPLYPWYVRMQPASGVDLSIWICTTRNGDFVDNCVDGSDNGAWQWNYVTVPAQWGEYYVIVTGSIDGYVYPACGGYQLTANA